MTDAPQARSGPKNLGQVTVHRPNAARPDFAARRRTSPSEYARLEMRAGRDRTGVPRLRSRLLFLYGITRVQLLADGIMRGFIHFMTRDQGRASKS